MKWAIQRVTDKRTIFKQPLKCRLKRNMQLIEKLFLPSLMYSESLSIN